MKKIYNLKYYMERDDMYKFTGCNGFDVWAENENGKLLGESELAKVLLEPFLKNLFKFSECYCITLNEINDDWGYFKEDIFYDSLEDKLYVQMMDDEDDYPSESIVILEKLLEGMKERSHVEEFVNLRKISRELMSEMERFCYFLYEHDIVKMFEYEKSRVGFTLNKKSINDSIQEHLINQYDKFPRLSTLAFYYSLINSLEELTSILYNILNEIVLSRGFISRSDDFIYRYCDKEMVSKVKDKIEAIIKKEDVTIDNFKNTVLNEIKYDMVEKGISRVCFNLLSISNVNGVTLVDEKQDINDFVNISHPLKCKWNNYDMHCNEKDIREIKGVKFNFSEENHMIFEMNVMPKCYAPSNTYIIDVNYSFKKQGRFLYLKDNISEKTSKEELKNLPIFINQMNVYTSDLVKKDWDN